MKLILNSRRRLALVLALVHPILVWPAFSFAQSDTTPPALVSFSFNPMTIDTTSGPATVTATVMATDDLSGVQFLFVNFRSPSGSQSHAVNTTLGPGTNVTGSGDVIFPPFSEPGTWVVEFLDLTDAVGNRFRATTIDLANRGLPTTLNVTSVQDVTPPQLVTFGFSPTAIDTTGAPATVTATVMATDDLSGVQFLFVNFRSPSGSQSHAVNTTLGPGTNVTGSGDVIFPPFSELGTWTIEFLDLTDAVGNRLRATTADLAARGFPTELRNIPSELSQCLAQLDACRANVSCATTVETFADLKGVVDALNTSALTKQVLNAALNLAQTSLDKGKNALARTAMAAFIMEATIAANLKASNPNRILLAEAGGLVCGAAKLLTGIP